MNLLKEVTGIRAMKKIGVLGGTFNPVHYGHLALAQEAFVGFGLDCVIFIPVGSPPHKAEMGVLNAEHRYMMCCAATHANAHFFVSRLEIARGGMSYTIDTVRDIKNACPNVELYFIIGADSVFEIDKWRDAQELLSSCRFIAASRAGVAGRRMKQETRKLRKRYGAEIYGLDIPGLNISSSDIRKRVGKGLPVRYLVPVKVDRYITENNLYKDKVKQKKPPLQVNEIKNGLKKLINEERYEHTLGVCETAVRLAELYGADVDKAEISALLHDCGKGLSDSEMAAYCKENKIKLDDYMQNDMSAVHALIGADRAKKVFGVKDKQILNAVKRHTIGSKNMGLLDKIIFVADVTEPGRPGIECIEEARAAAEVDLDAAVMAALNVKTEYLRLAGGELHPDSIKMLKKLEVQKCQTKED
jgi:nicotinate-nucleotide adenylyltransferase